MSCSDTFEDAVISLETIENYFGENEGCFLNHSYYDIVLRSTDAMDVMSDVRETLPKEI